MKSNKSTSLFPRELVLESLKQSFVKLYPRMMVRNPVMFIVEVCTALMIVATLYFLFAGVTDQGAFGYNVAVSVILFVTLLFANFAEAIAEARGKAQADSLRKTREETPAKLVENGTIRVVSSSRLKKGDVFVCEAGDGRNSDKQRKWFLRVSSWIFPIDIAIDSFSEIHIELYSFDKFEKDSNSTITHSGILSSYFSL